MYQCPTIKQHHKYNLQTIFRLYYVKCTEVHIWGLFKKYTNFWFYTYIINFTDYSSFSPSKYSPALFSHIPKMFPLRKTALDASFEAFKVHNEFSLMSVSKLCPYITDFNFWNKKYRKEPDLADTDAEKGSFLTKIMNWQSWMCRCIVVVKEPWVVVPQLWLLLRKPSFRLRYDPLRECFIIIRLMT